MVKVKRRPREKLHGDISRIAKVIGLPSAIKLVKAFRGTYLYIGGIDGILRDLRDMRIKQDKERGVNISRLAVKYNLSERRVRNILIMPAQAESKFPGIFDELL